MVLFTNDISELLIALGILLAGFIIAQIAYKGTLLSYRIRHGIVNLEKERKIRSLRTLIIVPTIIFVLIYLRAQAIGDLLSTTLTLLPDILSAVLLIILGLIVVNLIMSFIRKVLSTLGFMDYARQYGKKQIINLALLAVRLFLYLIVFESVLNLLGVYSVLLTTTIRTTIYGILIVFGVLMFFSLREYFENMFTGFQLKSMQYFKPGQRVIYQGEDAEVIKVSNTDATILTDNGYFIVLPFSQILKRDIKFEKTKAEIKTLEEIKNHFVAQTPSNCGPACLQMALSIYNYNFKQDEIAKAAGTQVGKGTHPEKLKEVVQELTQSNVRAHWISVDKITDLKTEIRTWLSDGAILMVDFKKKVIFPSMKTEKAHYTLCVGIEDDDLIILDPSGKAGGVYLVDVDTMYDGMDTYSDLIQGKRGYLVLAPRGTTAYWRIKSGFVYADKDVYSSLSINLDKKLDEIMKKSLGFTSVFPDPVNNYLKKWNERYKVGRLWQPPKKEN